MKSGDVSITYRPIQAETWPADQPVGERGGTFKATIGQSVQQIRYELAMLGVAQGVIELDVREHDIRKDGQMRQTLRTAVMSPRVRLSFELPGVGPLQYPCATYARHEHNLRAIGLTLEAQRAMDRYGATRRRQQYTGWKALPPGGDNAAADEQHMSAENAARFLSRVAGWPETHDVREIIEDPDVMRSFYRDACKATHPDTGGDPKVFQRVQMARRVLDREQGNPGGGAS
jgi:hypothetical protein